MKETGDSRYIYQNELYKAWHGMDSGDFKDLSVRAASDNVLCDKSFNNAENPKYDEYQRDLAPMIYKFSIKKILVLLLKVKLWWSKN